MINQDVKIRLADGEEAAREMKRLQKTIYPDFCRMDDEGAEYVFLGALDGVVAGYLALRDHTHSGTFGLSFFTDPAYRNRGVATTLTRYAVDFAGGHEAIPVLGAIVDEERTARLVKKAGFRFQFRAPYGNRATHYWLDTTGREPLQTYGRPDEINSSLTDVLAGLGVPEEDVAGLFRRMTFCESVLCASKTFDSSNGLLGTLGEYFDDSFVYPDVPEGMGFDISDLASAVRSVDPYLLGVRHEFAQDGQAVFFNKAGSLVQFAVVRPFQDEDSVTVNLYEMR
ncbi:MAG: GNAT family N-acetyltransferase [archaeon]